MSKAVSISRPVVDKLQYLPFTGRVLSVHSVACNLVDEQRDVITLLAPSVRDGPFSIVVDTGFEGIAVGDPVWADTKELVAGEWRVQLDGAAVWEPRPDWPRLRAGGERIGQGFAALDGWTSPALWAGVARITGADQYAEDTPTFMARLARGKEAYGCLIAEGLDQGKQESLVEGARLLAGLGPGGTPAGDDFLVGVMAAIWLLGDEADVPLIAETAAPRTSALSAAFLRAAGRGEFIAAWHALVGALAAGDPTQVEAAAKRVQNYGASSGADALEGFILAGRTLLNRIQEHINIGTRTNADERRYARTQKKFRASPRYSASDIHLEEERMSEQIVVTINRRDRTMVFPVNERDKLRELLKDRIWWDRRSNRWAGRGDVEELKGILEAAGYQVKLVGPR